MNWPACIDSHTHVFTADLPLTEGRRYSPAAPRPIEELLALTESHGVRGAVLVQPSFLGTDNTYLLNCLRRYPDRLRGVAVVEPNATAEALMALAAAGVAGIRLNVIESMGTWAFDETLRTLAAKAGEAGLHIELHAGGERLTALIEFLLPTGAVLVIDHFGRPGDLGPADPGFRSMLAAGRTGRIWVKLSGPYRVGFPDTHELARLLLAELGPERLVWGSDWPWTQNESGQSYAGLQTLLQKWITDEQQRETVVSRSAAALFRFNTGATVQATLDSG